MDRDLVGALIARVLAIADLVHVPTMSMMPELSRTQAKLALGEADPAGVDLLERYADWLTELTVTPESAATEP